MSFASLFLLFVAAIGVHGAEWHMQHENLATILMGVDMSSTEVGWIAGGDDGVGPVIYRTHDGGYEIEQTVDDVFEAPAIIMAVASVDTNNSAAVSGLSGWWGLLGPGASYTTDGVNWQLSEEMNYLAAAFQDADVADGVVFFPGYWYNNTNNQGCGVAISHDGGQTFAKVSWGIDYPDGSYCETARYASFLDSDNGFISGGHWPLESEEILFGDAEKDVYHFSRHVRIPLPHQEEFPEEVVHAFNARFEQPKTIAEQQQRRQGDSGYRAVLARTFDGGNTYQIVYDNSDGGFYFNSVSFRNATHGCVVGEGEGIGAAIFCTRDGGISLDIRWQQPTGASLAALDFSTPLDGWAGGMWINNTPNGPSVEALLLHTTDGGDTWTPVDAPFAPGHIVFVLSMSDPLHGNAVALNLASSSSALRYD